MASRRMQEMASRPIKSAIYSIRGLFIVVKTIFTNLSRNIIVSDLTCQTLATTSLFPLSRTAAPRLRAALTSIIPVLRYSIPTTSATTPVGLSVLSTWYQRSQF